MNNADVRVSGPTGTMVMNLGIIVQDSCCRYGNTGVKTGGYDCVIIPGAEEAQAGSPEPSRVCGRSKGLPEKIAGAVNLPATLCSTQTPFLIRFNTDNFEFAGTTIVGGANANREAMTTNADVGVRLFYFQDNTNCFSPS